MKKQQNRKFQTSKKKLNIFWNRTYSIMRLVICSSLYVDFQLNNKLNNPKAVCVYRSRKIKLTIKLKIVLFAYKLNNSISNRNLNI